MFYYISGKLMHLESNLAVLDVGGVGYKLTVSGTTYDAMPPRSYDNPPTVKLFTYLAVREDGIELFGFESNEERECFNKLITVSGVGPKAAMSILSIMTPDNFALAVCTEDTKAISKASGIGGKTAARIILELKDKIAIDMGAVTTAKSAGRATVAMPVSGNLMEATEALMVLGYDKNSVAGALAGLDPKADVGELIRAALKKLSR